jgi:hypothetical protein
LLLFHHNAQLSGKVARGLIETATPGFRFKVAGLCRAACPPETVKKSHDVRTGESWHASYFQTISERRQMRTLSFIIAVVSVLAGPSLAGPVDRDMPGIGTFIYCGSPIVTPAPEVMAAIGQ